MVAKWASKAHAEHGPAFTPLTIGLLLREAARPRDARPWFKRALREAETPKLSVTISLCAARCERTIGQYPGAALKAAQKALRDSIAASLPTQECSALIELGVLAADRGVHTRDRKHFEKALTFYRRAEKIARALGDIEKVGICVGNSGIARKNLGTPRHWRMALKDFGEALTVAVQVGDKRSEGRTTGNLGILHSVMGNSTLAIEHFRRAANIARELGDSYHEAIWLVGEADDTFAQDPGAAVQLVLTARNIFLPLSNARVKDCDEPPRVCRRLHSLRGWSHEQEAEDPAEVFAGGA
jgi:tetratricopeptide (TPR) repeat protein